MKYLFGAFVGVVSVIGFAQGQSTFGPGQEFAYGANTGWLNFRADETNGVQVTETYLSGYAYGANTGWMVLGDGSPVNGHTYSNASGDTGVNLSPEGVLSGYAWSANVGWVDFGWAEAKDPNVARIDLLSGEVSGFAYSANTGWIALGTPGQKLVTTSIHCPDSDSDGIGDAWEQVHFGKLSTVGVGTDHDKDGVNDASEFVAGTDPDDAADFFGVIRKEFNEGATQATVEFSSVPGRVYRVEHTTDVVNGAWTDSVHGIFLADAGATTTKVITTSTADRRY